MKTYVPVLAALSLFVCGCSSERRLESVSNSADGQRVIHLVYKADSKALSPQYRVPIKATVTGKPLRGESQSLYPHSAIRLSVGPSACTPMAGFLAISDGDKLVDVRLLVEREGKVLYFDELNGTYTSQ